jgi:putative intracellular protease/amidase
VAGADGRTVRVAGGTALDAAVVIWATGCRPDYSWIDIPGAVGGGTVIHRRGATEVPGLDFLGLSWQHTRGPALLGFVHGDAAHLAGLITSPARAAQPGRPARGPADGLSRPAGLAPAQSPRRPAAGRRCPARGTAAGNDPPSRQQTRSQHMSHPGAPGAAAAANGSQQPPKPVQIAFVLYPGFTALDIIGPFQTLAYVPGHEAVFVAAQPGPVTDDTGRCPLTATASLDQLTAPDVVVIGGSLSTKEPDQPVVQWLRQVHPTTTWTTSVCTGSIYLAAAGILDGQEATTYWARAEQLERHGARYTEQRVVEHGKVITAAGVSSGMDMALTLLGRMYGPQFAEGVQLAIEYDPQPPFDTGSPSKAPAEIVEFIRSQLNTLAAAEQATTG